MTLPLLTPKSIQVNEGLERQNDRLRSELAEVTENGENVRVFCSIIHKSVAADAQIDAGERRSGAEKRPTGV